MRTPQTFTRHLLYVFAVLAVLAMMIPLAAPVAAVNGGQVKYYTANLTGSQEVPPTPSTATGQFGVLLSADGSQLKFVLTVNNLANITAAHIHLAPVGVNGQVVVTLLSGGVPGSFSGVLAEGTITAANLQGPLVGQPLSALIAAMDAGNTYVNVHTTTFPGGEIRGQIILQPSVPQAVLNPASAHDIIGDNERFTVTNLPLALTVTKFVVTNTPNGAANAVIVNTSPLPGSEGAFVDVQAFGWGEAAVTAILSDNTTVTAFKKWGKIDATRISPAQDVPVIWNEQVKRFESFAEVTDVVTGTFLLEDPVTHRLNQFHEAAAGAVLNWFLLKDNPETQAWVQSKLGGGNPAGWWTSAALLAEIDAHPEWLSTFAAFVLPPPAPADLGRKNIVTTTGAGGTSTATIFAYGEEAVLVVVVPAYPNAPVTELQVPIEWTKINFWTPEMEKVPQVRWAGEKIVLEKWFGTQYSNWPVRFSLENQSPGALEGIDIGANLGNFTNTAQTVWSLVDEDGYARCILVSEAPGEVDVDLTLYSPTILIGREIVFDRLGDPVSVENQHGFVVFYLKLEDITLGSVTGSRTLHNAGLWEPSNPWDVSEDTVVDTFNVSADNLLRARVRGWFMGDNLSTRPERVQDYDPNSDSDNDGNPDNDADILLPAGRWVLPDDWPVLAGPDWQEQRIHWDIMDNPFDIIRSPAPSPADNNPFAVGYHGSGTYVKGYPTGPAVAVAQVVGPFRPGLEEPTWYGYNPNIRNLAVPRQKTVVPNGALEWWDAPMPPAKITFEITNGVGFFKDAFKSDIYYVWFNAAHTVKLYTNPFYFEMIPAHPQIPAFVNNGGYDWDSWAGIAGGSPSTVVWAPYGPYEFWKIINRPLPTSVNSSDMANFPTKVQVYSDNHGEAMVFLNGNWNLNLSPFLTNGAADVPNNTIVGSTTVVAMADYPYFRKHPKIISTNVTKTWTWGGMILGTDQVLFPGGAIGAATPMILSAGTYTITGGIYPNEVGVSPKKLVWLWLSDRDISPAGVMDVRIQWSVSGGGSVRIADFGYAKGISIYNDVTRAIELQNGFLLGTNGRITPGTAGTQGVSGVRAPNDIEEQLFDKFYPDLNADDFVVGAVELVTSDPNADVIVQILITSANFGMIPGVTGTVVRSVSLNFASAYPLDDEPIYGDANADGVVNMGDVIAVERTILGLKAPYVGADANTDNKINMGDVIKIEKIILGLE